VVKKLTILMQCHKISPSSTMSQQIVKIKSRLSTAIFDCAIYSNWQMNVYLE